MKSALLRGREPGDRGRETYADRGSLHRKLLELEQQDRMLPAHLLRTVYCAGLAVLTSGSELNLYCCEEGACFTLTVTMSDNIGALLSQITDRYTKAEKITAPKVITEQDRGGLICTYGFRNGDHDPLTRNSELKWNCSLNHEEFGIKVESTKLSDRILRALTERFLGLLRGVLGV